MKKKIEMTKVKRLSEEPDFKLGKRVADFLPSPEELAEADDVVRVTMFFSKKSVDFFKQQAKSRDSQYQKMIRRLVDSYVDRHALV
jgi:predicted DNA binding CopG/RHH family protein